MRCDCNLFDPAAGQIFAVLLQLLGFDYGGHDHDKKNTTEKERTTAEGAEGIGSLGYVLPRSLHCLSLSARCKQTVIKDCEIT